MNAYLRHHAQCLTDSVRELRRAPLASIMSVAVIGITLFLPAALYWALHSLQRVSADWDRGHTVTAYLKDTVDPGAGTRLAREFAAHPLARQARYISPAEAMAEFTRRAGLALAADTLSGVDNPLPGAIVIEIGEGSTSAGPLVAALRQHPAVAEVQFDDAWLQRLSALLTLGKRVVVLLAATLGLGVLLVVGNTIRSLIAQRQAEIEVIQLVGGTPAFTRRPFLYLGAVHGLAGAAVAAMALLLLQALIREPVATLAQSYGRAFDVTDGFVAIAVTLLALGPLLGLLGARLAAGRSIKSAIHSIG